MEAVTFGSTDEGTIWSLVSGMVSDASGSQPTRLIHYSVSIGIVVGLELSDGARVALKAFPPYHDPDFLAAAHRVRGRLAEEGYPAPRPLSSLVRLARGWACLEEWVDAPEPLPATDVVGPLAVHLADLLQRCQDFQRDPALSGSWQTFERPVGVWRNPPRPEVNLEADPDGAEWILEIAESARSASEVAPGPTMIGHVDWRPDNVRLRSDGSLAVVFDWDSIQLTQRVHFLAGGCSGLDPEGMAEFLSAFEAATGAIISRDERLSVAARVVWSHALWARFEYARALPVTDQRFGPRLREDVERYPAALGAAPW